MASQWLFLTAVLLSFIMVEAHTSYLNYTTVTGFFLQDDPNTNASTFDYTAVNFGLINRTYDSDLEYDPHHTKTQWQRFENQLCQLNRHAAGRHLRYKLLFLGRHGEGYHNVAEGFYGTPAWDCYWSKLDGNTTVTWADAHLTDKGIKQAERANAFWAKEIAVQKIPLPESYYTSPLSRCLSTANITFSGLNLPAHPKVKELLRESIGIHTCDRRSSKSYIRTTFPTFTFEPNFAETDPLWKPDLRETDSAQEARLKTLLDDIFTHDESTYLSFTSHGGSIGALLRAIGHRPFGLVTGGVIPVLVRAERIYAPEPRTSIAAPTSAPTCTANPTSSPKGL